MSQIITYLHEGDEVIETYEFFPPKRRLATIKRIVPAMGLILLDNNNRYDFNGEARIGCNGNIVIATPELKQELENERTRPHKIERLQNMQWENLGDEALNEILGIIDYVYSLPPIAADYQSINDNMNAQRIPASVCEAVKALQDEEKQ